jgi:putative nucleotidyltransferase with HDIG domain
MSAFSTVAGGSVQPLDVIAIEAKLKECPRLPSLRTIGNALRELLGADHHYTGHISEIVRRDPSLTARLLRMANSIYYGFSTPITSIEEAVFYLGVRQIRQLAMVTPVLEDFQRLAPTVVFPWREFWRHCLGVAILTREVTTGAHTQEDESDYVAGLLHDVGKIVMAWVFPEHFATVQRLHREVGAQGADTLLELEKEVFGLTHAELGAMYLQNHHLPEVVVQSALYHHDPVLAANSPLPAAVQISDLLVRHAKLGQSGNLAIVSEQDIQEASGWSVLLPDDANGDRTPVSRSLQRALEQLPTVLQVLV